jgi:hypothetical protein
VKYGSIISESGLYLLVLRSDKPQARSFRGWITDDVIPTLRRTGKYELSTTTSEQPDLLAALNRIDERLGRLEGKPEDGRFTRDIVRYVCEGVAKHNNCECTKALCHCY